MDYNVVKNVALDEMQKLVNIDDRASIIKLQESIAIAIAKAFEEYDKQKMD